MSDKIDLWSGRDGPVYGPHQFRKVKASGDVFGNDPWYKRLLFEIKWWWRNRG